MSFFNMINIIYLLNHVFNFLIIIYAYIYILLKNLIKYSNNNI